MAVREILKYGDARLLRVARQVQQFDTPELDALIEDLFDTMRAANGAGLAAPQIGVDAAVVVFGFEHNPRYPNAEPVPTTVLLNPIIELIAAEETGDWEGCLSVPGMRGWVTRWTKIRYRGHDPHGQPIAREASGFHARVVQHECDHLFGKLYPMRIRDLTRFGFTSVLFPDLPSEPE